jgi:hypothetical protein
VLVNRVWQGHFAQGLVRTPSNFGLRGASPSHPDLLDWLARSFVADGWSMKSLHRRIMLSRTYGMDSAMDPAAIARDPDNRLLWRQNRRRLEAELVRDAILAVSGSLQTEMGGTLLPTPNRGYVTNDQSGNQAGYDARRRAVYLPLIRNAMYDVFTTFDFNDPSVPVDQRPATVIPSQALFVLNSPLVIQESAAFARSLFSEGHRDPAVRHARAYRRAFGRPPTSVETARDLDWIASRQRALELATPSSRRGPLVDDDASAEFLAWQSFCQVLFASSEFLYVD